MYPTYVDFCDRYDHNPLSVRKFTKAFVAACEKAGLKGVKSSRTSKLAAVENVRIREHVKSIEYQLGTEFDETTTEITINSNVNNLGANGPVDPVTENMILYAVDGSVNSNVIVDYVKNLVTKEKSKKDLKVHVNKMIKQMDLSNDSVEELLKEFVQDWGVKDATISFVKYKREHLIRCANVIKKKGMAIYSYKSMGASPRFLPTSYKNSINGMNKSFRKMLFNKIGDLLHEEYKMVVLDLDLASCYTTVLIALYPRKLVRVKRAVEAGSIWEALKKEFINIGRPESYQKPYVKACFYSVIFGGGKNAMVNSILKNVYKTLGMTETEFIASSFYESEKTKANDIANAFSQLPMVMEFKEMSKQIQRNFQGETFTGPAGHRDPINESSFQSSFANFLQGFEVSLLCESTNETLKKFP